MVDQQLFYIISIPIVILVIVIALLIIKEDNNEYYSINDRWMFSNNIFYSHNIYGS
jgi:hypothetical protein